MRKWVWSPCSRVSSPFSVVSVGQGDVLWHHQCQYATVILSCHKGFEFNAAACLLQGWCAWKSLSKKVTLLGVCVSALLRLLGGQNPLVSGPDAPTCPHRWLRKCGLQGVDYVLTLEGQGCLYLSRQGCQTPSRFLRVVAQALRKVGRSCYSVCCKGGGHSMVSVDQNYIRQLGLCIFSGRICETDGGRPLPVESRIGIRRCLQN